MTASFGRCHDAVVVEGSNEPETEVEDEDQSPQDAVVEMIESHLGPEQTAALKQLGIGSIEELVQSAMSDPEGFTARMQERVAAAQQAAIAQAEAARAQAMAAQAGPAATAAATTAAARTAGGHDSVDSLEKLADLRDRGVLTPEEFETLKKRVLAE